MAPVSKSLGRPDKQPDQLAFIVVNLGPRPYADVGLALLDLMEAIDAVPGCRTESTGSFPADQRPLLNAYVEAAKQHE